MSEEAEVNKVLADAGDLYFKGMNTLNQANLKLQHVHYKYPNNTSILLALAANLASTGVIRDAIEIYDKVLQIDNRNVYALVGLARIRYQLNDVPAAFKFLKKALAIDPNQYDAQMLYAQIHFTNGDIGETKKILEHILVQNPSDAQANAIKDRILHIERGDSI